jgi:general secretion pathway protein D
MKKLLAFLLLLCAVSCKQTTTQNKYLFQEPKSPAPKVATTTKTNASAAEPLTLPGQQFNAGRTNTMPVPPATNAYTAPTLSTNMPKISVNPPSVPINAPEEIIPAGTINFPSADLNQVLDVYAGLVNRTILRPANLGAPQITLKTQTPLTKREAIQALDAVLALNGISVINIGDKFAKVVPAAQANTEGGARDLRDASELPDLGQYVTHVVQLKYVKPSEIVPALQPFAKLNSILPIDASQILIIRDYTENVKRMLEMIAEIDVTVPSEYVSEVIPIKYAKASDISDALNSLGAGGGGGGGTVGGGAARSGTTGRTRGAATSGYGGGFGGGLNRTGFGQTGATPYGGGMAAPGGITQPGGAMGTPGGSFTDRLNNLIRKASATGELQLFGQMKIITDERSNSLLIFATRQDLDMIKSVISKLDVVLAQVEIDTLILDVQIGHGWNYGISAGQPPKRVGGTTNSPVVIGGVQNNSDNSLGTLSDFFGNVASGTNGTGIFPSASGLQYFGRYKGDIDVAIQAAASDSRVNVVQNPKIITTHATPGSIFVGSTVPYITGSTYGGYGGYGNSYQQLSVGIGLNVTPYINQDGLVVMEIEEQIDEISGSIAIANVGDVPTTTHRELSSEVAVRDGDTIILGGFIRNSDSKTSSGVPLLKDIPLLGALFQSKSDTKQRNELLVLMRPTVLKTPEIAAHQTLVEKGHLPGVMRAEADVQIDEHNEAERTRKELLNRKDLTPAQKAYLENLPKE